MCGLSSPFRRERTVETRYTDARYVDRPLRIPLRAIRAVRPRSSHVGFECTSARACTCIGELAVTTRI